MTESATTTFAPPEPRTRSPPPLPDSAAVLPPVLLVMTSLSTLRVAPDPIWTFAPPPLRPAMLFVKVSLLSVTLAYAYNASRPPPSPDSALTIALLPEIVEFVIDNVGLVAP